MTQPENAAQADIARLVSEINANPDNWQAYADLGGWFFGCHGKSCGS